MTPARPVRTEVRGDALVVTLDRPDRRNALTVECVHLVADAVEGAEADGARAIVLTGEPPAFCSGGDLDDLLRVVEQGAAAASEMIYGGFHRMVRAIRSTGLPVVAAVNGPAMGAGLDLAVACDLRVATTDAQFASAWIAMGLVPGMGGAYLLPKLLGATRAAEILLTGRRLSAEAALAWGLVNDVVDPSQLWTRVDSLVGALSSRPARALARTKAAMLRGLDDHLADELAMLGATQGLLLTASEFGEAVDRFTTGRREP